MDNNEIIRLAREVLEVEADAVRRLIDYIDDNFCGAVRLICESKGRVIASGIGKSGIIAQKISATLASMGKPSLFLHPVEAVHGDLGRVTDEDIILAFSNSGETAEIIALLPFIRRLGGKIIAITGNVNSTLSRNSDWVLNSSIIKEACSMNLAPTASTTASLALGDALCVAVSCINKVDSLEFAKYHPGGILGRNLILTVKEIMVTGNDLPCVSPDTSLKDAVISMSSGKLGIVLLCDSDKVLSGILTDGDLRRILQKNPQSNFLDMPVSYYASCSPKTISGDCLAEEAISKMENKKITSLIVVTTEKKIEGVVHLHQLLSARVI